MYAADKVWADAYNAVNSFGTLIEPRGMKTRELLHQSFAIDMNYPVVRNYTRKLSYRFMAGEAWWILSGRSDVESIVKYNKKIADYSDDGERFFGAYGPPIRSQLSHVVGALMDDRDTRQAVLTIWRPNPPKTKDVPCTVTMQFMIRENKLNAHVYMRSSDVWLGLPYDIFNFSMVAAYIRAWLHTKLHLIMPVDLGTLYLTTASSHVYEQHWDKNISPLTTGFSPIPEDFARTPEGLVDNLKRLADEGIDSSLRWWKLQ